MGWLFSKHDTTPEPEEEEFLPAAYQGSLEDLEKLEAVFARAHEHYTQEGEYYCGLCQSMQPITHFPHDSAYEAI